MPMGIKFNDDLVLLEADKYLVKGFIITIRLL